MTATPPGEDPAAARLFASVQLRADVRLFHTAEPMPCLDDPDLFFDPRARRRAIALCVQCPFRGRCGYNAVAAGATHGIWGGILLPGAYPAQLAPLYAQLRAQFDERRREELGEAPVTPLPEEGLAHRRRISAA